MDREKFLIEYYKDCQTEMRWRRDSVHKFMTLSIGLNTAVIPVSATLGRYLEKEDLLISSIALILMTILVTVLIHKNIYREHKVYEQIGGIVVNIWKGFGLFNNYPSNGDSNQSQIYNQILPDGSKDYGKGMGYKNNLKVIWSSTIVTIIFLAVLVITNYFF